MSTKMTIESSICSATTVHAAPVYTTVTVVSTYTSSCPSTSLEKLTAVATATCVGHPDVPTTHQNAVNKTSFIKTTVEHSANIAIKTVMLTSLLSSFLCNGITTFLVPLPTTVDDVGYVKTAECACFLCIYYSYLLIYV